MNFFSPLDEPFFTVQNSLMLEKEAPNLGLVWKLMSDLGSDWHCNLEFELIFISIK